MLKGIADIKRGIALRNYALEHLGTKPISIEPPITWETGSGGAAYLSTFECLLGRKHTNMGPMHRFLRFDLL